MRKLVEDAVREMLNDEFDISIDNCMGILDLDLGIWNADEGPALDAEVISTIVKECDDQELLEVYTFLVSGV
jgi:hypothetical protein